MLRNSGCAKSARRFDTRELGRIEGAGHRGLSGWEHPAHVARLPGGRATLRGSRSGRGSPPLKWISGGRVQVAPAGSRETPLPPLTSLPGSQREACAEPPARPPVRQRHRRTLSPQSEPAYPPGSYPLCPRSYRPTETTGASLVRALRSPISARLARPAGREADLQRAGASRATMRRGRPGRLSRLGPDPPRKRHQLVFWLCPEYRKAEREEGREPGELDGAAGALQVADDALEVPTHETGE